MKRLVIHPKDPSTRFLCGIYDTIPNKTVINSGITKEELRKEIARHDRILMMGHGSPAGLFSIGRFPGAYPYIVDDSMAESLYNKECILIWCFADQFLLRNNLIGFCTGMFISEVSEALWYDFDDIDGLDVLIEESNYGFAEIVSKYITLPLDVLHKNVLLEYSEQAKTNPIASFNFKRLYLSQSEPAVFYNNVINIQ